MEEQPLLESPLLDDDAAQQVVVDDAAHQGQHTRDALDDDTARPTDPAHQGLVGEQGVRDTSRDALGDSLADDPQTQTLGSTQPAQDTSSAEVTEGHEQGPVREATPEAKALKEVPQLLEAHRLLENQRTPEQGSRQEAQGHLLRQEEHEARDQRAAAALPLSTPFSPSTPSTALPLQETPQRSGTSAQQDQHVGSSPGQRVAQMDTDAEHELEHEQQLDIQIELRLQCRNLLQMDWASALNPMMGIFERQENDADLFELVDHTETLSDDLNPNFERRFRVNYKENTGQLFLFRVYAVQGHRNEEVTEEEFFASALVNLDELVTEALPNQPIVFQLTNPHEPILNQQLLRAQCTLFLSYRAENKAHDGGTKAQLSVQCYGLPASGVFATAVPLVGLFEHDRQRETMRYLAQTETNTESQNPTFQNKFIVDYRQGTTQEFELSVYDSQTSPLTESRRMGSCWFELPHILERMGSEVCFALCHETKGEPPHGVLQGSSVGVTCTRMFQPQHDLDRRPADGPVIQQKLVARSKEALPKVVQHVEQLLSLGRNFRRFQLNEAPQRIALFYRETLHNNRTDRSLYWSNEGTRECHPTRCMPLLAITDIIIGKQSRALQSSLAELARPELCLSIVAFRTRVGRSRSTSQLNSQQRTSSRSRSQLRSQLQSTLQPHSQLRLDEGRLGMGTRRPGTPSVSSSELRAGAELINVLHLEAYSETQRDAWLYGLRLLVGVFYAQPIVWYPGDWHDPTQLHEAPEVTQEADETPAPPVTPVKPPAKRGRPTMELQIRCSQLPKLPNRRKNGQLLTQKVRVVVWQKPLSEDDEDGENDAAQRPQGDDEEEKHEESDEGDKGVGEGDEGDEFQAKWKLVGETGSSTGTLSPSFAEVVHLTETPESGNVLLRFEVCDMSSAVEGDQGMPLATAVLRLRDLLQDHGQEVSCNLTGPCVSSTGTSASKLSVRCTLQTNQGARAYAEAKTKAGTFTTQQIADNILSLLTRGRDCTVLRRKGPRPCSLFYRAVSERPLGVLHWAVRGERTIHTGKRCLHLWFVTDVFVGRTVQHCKTDNHTNNLSLVSKKNRMDLQFESSLERDVIALGIKTILKQVGRRCRLHQ